MGLLSFVENTIAMLSMGLRQPLAAFCKLETVEDEYTFVSGDGSLVSLLRIDGAFKLVGERELAQIVDGASLAMAPYLERPGHALQFYFLNDPDGAGREVAKALVSAERTAKAVGLDLSDLFTERKRVLPEFLSAEACYIALWTRPVSLTKAQLKAAMADNKEFLKAMPPAGSAQTLQHVADGLRTRHKAFVAQTQSDFETLGLLCELETVHEGLRAIRHQIFPELSTSNWKPCLPGDKVPARVPENGEKRDISSLIWPRLSEQIFVRDGEVVNPSAVRIGANIWTSVDLILAPEETQAFSVLLARMNETDAPWRVSFMLEGAGLAAVSMKGIVASILAWASDDNKKIHRAVKDLQALQLDGTTIVKLRVNFATWAPVGEERLLRERAATLLRSVEGWGNAQATDQAGDPLEGVMSSALGLAVASTAPAAAAPLADAVRWLPWSRPANPWRRGAVMFRTNDGKPWPYQPGSSLQTSFIDLVFAPPGYGKSVLMNTVNLAVSLAPSTTTTVNGQLPRIAIIDIGPSSSGLVSLLKEALPDTRRHEVAYHRLRMEPSNAINIFDTQLGCRKPMPTERAFIVNMLTLLATPVGSRAPYDGITDLVGIVVDELYKMFADAAQPRPYSPSDDLDVDEALQRNLIKVPDKPTWWDLVDIFFKKGKIREALLAQRHAVPLLQDVVLAARSRAVQDLFGETRAPTGEPIVEAFTRMISGAIREYPILASPTRFDIGAARVVSLDLDEVAPRGGEAADRQTSVMYMLARHVLARDFYLNEETVKSMAPEIRPYHMKRAREMRETPKRLVYDEFHRTSASDAVRSQVRIDIREGRKWGVQICLASQLLEDFDGQMVDQATGVWILGTGSEAAVEESVKRFGLSATSEFVIRNRLTGPGRGGAPFLAMLKLKNGRYEQFLVNTLGPVELWAMSTTAEDAAIRQRLYAIVGPASARARLAKRFKGGSAKGEIERRINEQMDSGANEEKASSSVLDEIVNELAAMDMD